MANTDNNNSSDEEKIDPMKDIRAGIVREVGSQAIWSLSSCKPGNVTFFFLFYVPNSNYRPRFSKRNCLIKMDKLTISK